MQNSDLFESLTYLSEEPNVNALRRAYDNTVIELEPYFDVCRTSYDDRRNYWNGKSRDLRKHGADAFPWDGASDMEAHTIDERITRLVSLFMSSLNRANIRAYPVEVQDIGRSKVVSDFLRWMVKSGYINRFQEEMELGANYLLERGLMVTYIGWNREDTRFKQRITMDQVGQMNPEIYRAILEGTNDEELVALLTTTFEGITDKVANKAIKELRDTSETVLPLIRRIVDAPEVKTLAPDGDFFFPSYVTDPQRAPYCFWRTSYTAQELENKVITDGWDQKFVSYVIDKYRGTKDDLIDRDRDNRRSLTFTDEVAEEDELIEIVYGYQRLIDPTDGAQGIYCTVFHREFSGNDDVPGFAKFELLNGYEDYPVVVTRLSEDSKRMYDTMTFPQILRGIQNQIKIERDSRIDRNSIATMPPIIHPVGQAPTDWGPGRYIPYRRKGDIDFAPTPPPPTGSIEMEQTQQAQADRLCGLDETSQISQIRKQFLVDKFLMHNAKVLKMAFKCYQRFGPDSIFFRVTGVPESVQMSKGNPNENFDIMINYDVLTTDPEAQAQKLQGMLGMLQYDRNGLFNIDNLLTGIASSIDPVLADGILQSPQVARDEIIRGVTDDLAKIFAGIEMPARSNGGQVAVQLVQQYSQQPDIAARLDSDPVFADRLQKYVGQYTFQMQQAENAQIGRIGTAPAEVGNINTQNANQSSY
jgi:ribosomal protein S8